MSNRPPLNWGSALRDLRGDRLARPDVREERLRPTISAWRGKSGRRYVFSIERLNGFCADDAIGALVLFTTRDTLGIARIAFGAADFDRPRAADAVESADEQGCTEVHVCRLWDADEQDAILADLNVTVAEVA